MHPAIYELDNLLIKMEDKDRELLKEWIKNHITYLYTESHVSEEEHIRLGDDLRYISDTYTKAGAMLAEKMLENCQVDNYRLHDRDVRVTRFKVPVLT